MADTYRTRWWQFWLPVCSHDFLRPARTGTMPTLYCDDCLESWHVTHDEFYARTGISFEALTGIPVRSRDDH